MFYYEVSPTSLIRQDASVFSYASENEVAIGSVVKVPVGKKTFLGVVIRQVTKPEYETKQILQVLDQPPLPKELIKTAQWMSDFYHTHPSLGWQTVLPRGLDKKRRHAISSVGTPDIAYTETPEAENRTKNVSTKDQSGALKTIQQMTPGTALLHGITGSGKTLVYIESARHAAEKGLSSIILVPEISLTAQLVSEFAKHLDNIILTHSRQTEAERHLVWLKTLRADKPVVVIGPRSALFMPVSKLGLIVIDECHEPSFKQEKSPRYSALRVAYVLAREHQAKLVLGSATPSVANYYLAQKSSRPIITMTKSARNDTVKPDIKLVDMTKRGNFIQHYFLSDLLLNSLEQTFENGHQALIFHNRRGTASVSLCQNCGWQAGCPNCFVPLTLHADKHRLLCHICGFGSKIPTSCPECQSPEIIHKGIGTKRIEEELKKIFPNKIIARFDADTANEQTVEQRYQELKDGSIDLIIGTQVIAKGLDLPNLRTVGVVQADAGLSLPDFSAPERSFQLLAQVIGRVGRSHHASQVIVQSYQPEHPAIVDGLGQNYADFYERTIKQRRATNFPPFCHLLKLTCIYKTENTAIKNSKKIAELLKKEAPKSVEILGPTPAFYERVRDTYRWQIVAKSPSRQDLVNLLAHLPPKNWQYELDPISLL